MERQRGISITSTVLRFTHNGVIMNLLDTPGHRDFSEDTYRVLSAADCAVMVLDAAKGVEEQTEKLFQVCRRRNTPLLTFINKLDRPGLDPLALLDDIRDRIGIEPTPVTWPVGDPGDFRGVVDRRNRNFHRFGRTARGATVAPEEIFSADESPVNRDLVWHRAAEEVALLDELGADLDVASFLAGETTPVFFGSALTNFGVRLLLDAVKLHAPPPRPRPSTAGTDRRLDAPFSGFVFKVQANMDPRHRDRIAFVRVCSGRFERGTVAINARTGRPFTMTYAHHLFGRRRDIVELAYPGDIVGLVNASDLNIGDTLYVDEPVHYPPIPTFAPEHFRFIRNRDAGRYKQFRKSLVQLEEEGVIQVLRHPDRGDQEPVLAAVGPMQFEVAQHRLEKEFRVPVSLHATEYVVARVTDAPGERALATARDAAVLHRSDGTRLALFKSRFMLDRFERDHPEVALGRIVTL